LALSILYLSLGKPTAGDASVSSLQLCWTIPVPETTVDARKGKGYTDHHHPKTINLGVKRSLFQDFSMRVWLFVMFYVGKTMHFYYI